jgi:hypothetical protein
VDVFPFNVHTPTHSFPRGDAVRFGRGYTFTTKPQLPFQRSFRLYFSGMKWYLNTDGTVDNTTNVPLNMQALIDFFTAHDYSQPFIYNHELYGNITVKFAADHPFEVVKSLVGGSGLTEPFELFLEEQPGL